ncbi:hypothetical protein [Acetobacter sp. DsW_063]|uniref:hypothetical protein n=1 Tax=Acetobacter sp. DsW_063 TaxID=1514894 RepID=UPI001178776D|nr:hypothetical protein [Acetobacter sp. DsW_063]
MQPQRPECGRWRPVAKGASWWSGVAPHDNAKRDHAAILPPWRATGKQRSGGWVGTPTYVAVHPT